MSIVFSPSAQRDLEEAHEFLSENNPAAAARFLERLQDVLADLDSGLIRGPEVRLRPEGKARSWPASPYRVYYQRENDVLLVLRVYHQARAPIERTDG